MEISVRSISKKKKIDLSEPPRLPQHPLPVRDVGGDEADDLPGAGGPGGPGAGPSRAGVRQVQAELAPGGLRPRGRAEGLRQGLLRLLRHKHRAALLHGRHCSQAGVGINTFSLFPSKNFWSFSQDVHFSPD